MTSRKKKQTSTENAFDPFDFKASRQDHTREEKKVEDEHFDLFRGGTMDPFPHDDSDPWEQDPWTSFDTSFESPLQYPAASAPVDLPDLFEIDVCSKNSKDFMKVGQPKEFEHTIPIKVQERLSILFDNGTSTPTCRVIGFIYVSALACKTWINHYLNSLSLFGIRVNIVW